MDLHDDAVMQQLVFSGLRRPPIAAALAACHPLEHVKEPQPGPGGEGGDGGAGDGSVEGSSQRFLLLLDGLLAGPCACGLLGVCLPRRCLVAVVLPLCRCCAISLSLLSLSLLCYLFVAALLLRLYRARPAASITPSPPCVLPLSAVQIVGVLYVGGSACWRKARPGAPAP